MRWILLTTLLVFAACKSSEAPPKSAPPKAASAPATEPPPAAPPPATEPAPPPPATKAPPPPPTTTKPAGECKTDGDCRLVSHYCTGCDCLSLPPGKDAPKCDGPGVQCVADPCMMKQAACRNGACTTVDKAESDQ